MCENRAMSCARTVGVCALPVIACVAVIGDLGCRPTEPPEPVPMWDAGGGGVCKALVLHLKTYYGQLTDRAPEDIDADFAKYAQACWRKCAVTAPPPSRQGTGDLGVHLLLPEKLESRQPAVIAYTGGRPNDARTIYWSEIIVLRGHELVHLRGPSWRAEMIVGKENMAGRKPDLYYWSRGRQ